MKPRRHLRSWVDVVIGAIDRIPGPAWAAYAGLIALSIAVTVVLRVIDGMPIEVLAIVFGGLTFTPFAFIHGIDRAAGRAFDDFRPALGALQPQAEELRRRLTTTGFATGIVGAAIGIAIVVAGTSTAGGSWGVDPRQSVPTNVVTVVLLLVFNAGSTTFILHALGQLRTIVRIHRDATNIQLWNPLPHNAFSRVTALAALAFTVPYASAALLSALTTEHAIVAVLIVAVTVALAALLFAAPLVGMRRRLLRERERQVSETDRASQAVADELRGRVDAGELASAAELESVLSALAAERERLRKVSAWPWTADTLRAFLTTLGLPVLLWFVTTWLGRLLFA